jgi:hypothetical protein
MPAMRIYFAGAISGGRDDLSIYQYLIGRLKALGHTVPTEHVASPHVFDEERAVAPRAVYERDMAWLQECDALIAEVSTPSLGVGFEIAHGLERGLPVLCLYREGLSVSQMITGNTSPHLTVASYLNRHELDHHVDRFLALRRSTSPGML